MKLKYRNIAISGPIGSGKSTLSRNLSVKLGWRLLHAGEYFRKWHEENKVPLEESEKVPEEMDRQIDMGYQKKMSEEEHVIFESHLAGWLAKDLPKVLKVLCTADLQTRMDRTAAREGISPEEALKEADQRSEAHREKFERLYGVKDRFNPEYFDLVIDTGKLSPEEAVEEVMKKLEN